MPGRNRRLSGRRGLVVSARQVRRQIGSIRVAIDGDVMLQTNQQLAGDIRAGKARVRRDTGAMQRNFYGDQRGIHNRQRYANWQEYGTRYIGASGAVRRYVRRHARQYAIGYVVDAIDRQDRGRPTERPDRTLTNQDILSAQTRRRSRTQRRSRRRRRRS